MRHPSRDIMNDLARSVLLLYSYDENPDDISAENLLTQSIKLIGSFPAIVANAYAVNRHYFDGESLHIHYPSAELSAAENFLRMIRPDASYTEEEAHLLDMMMMIHAEHQQRQQLNVRLPRPVFERHGHLQRDCGRGWVTQGAPARRRERQGHADVPRREGARGRKGRWLNSRLSRKITCT